ncbi:MAG: hypothetical protein KAG53_04165 [Endozoicomonadaceae bacterium]|nr:hypothetical protein [Endozoicomonadaceae bacterium]
MQKSFTTHSFTTHSFTTQPKFFVSATELNHPIFHSLDDMEALLDWSDIEKLISSIYT